MGFAAFPGTIHEQREHSPIELVVATMNPKYGAWRGPLLIERQLPKVTHLKPTTI